MKHIDVIGKNHHAISMIFETAKQLHGHCHINIYQNIPDEKNESAHVEFAVSGISFDVQDVEKFHVSGHQIVIAGMSPQSREAIYRAFGAVSERSVFQALIHPSAIIASTAIVEDAVRIEPGVVVAPYARLGFGVLVNRNASIGHHSILEYYVNINPGVIVNGNCKLGKSVTIGAGAIINDGVIIGAGSMIGSGSVVTKDVPPGVLSMGVPAKIIKNL